MRFDDSPVVAEEECDEALSLLALMIDFAAVFGQLLAYLANPAARLVKLITIPSRRVLEQGLELVVHLKIFTLQSILFIQIYNGLQRAGSLFVEPLLRRRWLDFRPSIIWIHPHAHLEWDLLALDARAADGLVACGVEGVGLDDLVVEPLHDGLAHALAVCSS